MQTSLGEFATVFYDPLMTTGDVSQKKMRLVIINPLTNTLANCEQYIYYTHILILVVY